MAARISGSPTWSKIDRLATTASWGSRLERPSSKRTYVITDMPGALISVVARPAATRRAAKGGSFRVDVEQVERMDFQQVGDRGHETRPRSLQAGFPEP